MLDWRKLPDAPGRIFEPRYVYLCLFPAIAKVGVTRSPRGRITALRREHGDPLEVHAHHVGFFESVRREAAIKEAFGRETRRRGRRSEFFPTEHFQAAVEMVGQRTPEFRERYMRAVPFHNGAEDRYGHGEAA